MSAFDVWLTGTILAAFACGFVAAAAGIEHKVNCEYPTYSDLKASRRKLALAIAALFTSWAWPVWLVTGVVLAVRFVVRALKPEVDEVVSGFVARRNAKADGPQDGAS